MRGGVPLKYNQILEGTKVCLSRLEYVVYRNSRKPEVKKSGV
jgi:hypothetical protein